MNMAESLIFIDFHWLSLIIIEYHWLSLIILINYIWKSKKYQLLTDWLTHSRTTWNQEMLAHLKRNAINQKTWRSTSKYQKQRKYCWGNIVDLREYCRSELHAWSWKPSQWHSGSFVLPLYALPPSTGNHEIILVLSLCNIFIFSRAQWKMWPTLHKHRISSNISTRVDEFSFKQVWCCDKSKIKELLWAVCFHFSFLLAIYDCLPVVLLRASKIFPLKKLIVSWNIHDQYFEHFVWQM